MQQIRLKSSIPDNIEQASVGVAFQIPATHIALKGFTGYADWDMSRHFSAQVISRKLAETTKKKPVLNSIQITTLVVTIASKGLVAMQN